MPALADQLHREAAQPMAGTVTSEDGSVVLLHHGFQASEGPMGHPHQLRLGLLLAGGGNLYQRTSAGLLQAAWNPGQFNVVLPGDHGHYASPAVELLGMAVDTAQWRDAPGGFPDIPSLSLRLHRDPVIASVLHALWSSAQADACVPGFLQHGAEVVVRRLAQLAGQPHARPPMAASLSSRQLRQLQDFIDEHRSQPLDVAALAGVLGMEPTTFSRALRAATGMPPYAYLTQRRMQWAQCALSAGQSVTDVALACGYANPSKFAAAFRRVAGCTPSAWAAQGTTHQGPIRRTGVGPATASRGRRNR
ncbi:MULTISPECIES: AraC family transcriptional regulator [Stenotrophomonas]|uniref:helix-turn-helix transcriptional regulator n=1 Tax=Stenotrophomonas TaxID=40323 RepID=UPI000B6C28F8|nr:MULTISPECIES: AraC family transcriptional regulator [Stenotrophomonas]SMR81145.1 AraC family transcriptional regulator [Stenotrophomonas sp. yr243]SNS34740.1 AraC family transcriptional regulator [Stenotrophomonas lactitubi]